MSSGRWLEKRVLKISADEVWGNHFPPFVGFDEALEMALFKQPEGWHPLYPPECWGAQLLRCVRSALEESLCCNADLKGQIVSNTGLYVAVGTVADYWHDTDAIVCCDLGDAAPVVTVDLKAHPDNGEAIREDHVIITEEHFNEIASNGKLRLENIAGAIADILIFKLEELGVLPSPRVFSVAAF